MIDVSQSVEHDHPRALDFLRKDCINANAFFRKFNVPTLSLRELFDFITDPNITDENIDEYLTQLQERAAARTLNQLTEQEKVEEEVFKTAYIPQRLDEVIDYENDVDKVQKGGEKVIYYGTITALRADLSGASTKPALLEENNNAGDQSNDSSSDGSSDEDGDEDAIDADGSDVDEGADDGKFKSSARPRDESPNARRERKRAVKEAQKEKRKEKMPKKIKKRKVKVSNTNATRK